jgi:hypothetical protein
MTYTAPFELTGLTHQQLRAEFDALAAKLLPGWDSTNVNDPLNFVTDAYLSALAHNNWFANEMALQFNLLTATDQQMTLGHMKRLGYSLQTAQPSSVLVQVDYVNTSNVDVLVNPFSMRVATVPSSTVMQVFYENASAFTLSGSGTLLKGFVEGRSYTERFVASGKTYQTYTMNYTPVIIETLGLQSLEVRVGGILWELVGSLRLSDVADRHYIIEVDTDYRLSILFGDDVNGMIPRSGLNIDVRYRVGGGLKRNVAAGTLTIIDTAPACVTAVNNNYEGSAGGVEAETLTRAKYNAVNSQRDAGQLNRLKAIQLFIESTTGARSSARLIGNAVDIYLVIGGNVNSQAFAETCQAVKDTVSANLIMGYSVSVSAGLTQEVGLDLDVVVSNSVNASTVKLTVEQAIDNLLDPYGLDANGVYYNEFGRGFYLSDLYKVVKSIDGVIDLVIRECNTVYNGILTVGGVVQHIQVDPIVIITNAHLSTKVNVTIVSGTNVPYYGS